MQPDQSVFAFDDPVEFLNFQLRERQKKDPRFSLRAWARQIGYENPSYLSHVLKRERRLSHDLGNKLADTLLLEGKARRYFDLAVLKEAANTEMEKNVYQKMKVALRPRKMRSVSQLSLEYFSTVADWYHSAILEMPLLAGFDGTQAAISRRLGAKVTNKNISAAVDRLVKIGLLGKDAKGRIRRANLNDVVTEPVPSEYVRSRHEQTAELARRAVQEQTSEERDYRGTAISFHSSQMEEARAILAEAHDKIRALAAEGTGENIYQLNTQFFRLTTPQNGKERIQ